MNFVADESCAGPVVRALREPSSQTGQPVAMFKREARLAMKRIGFAAIISVLLSIPALGQTRPTWPSISLSDCPGITPSKSLSERTWKDGEEERNAFQAIGKVQDQKQAAERLIAFADQYPDSDYKEIALILAIGVGASLKDVNLQSDAATVLVESRTGEATALVAGFATLDANLSPYVRGDDPEETQKLADLEVWTKCGRQALAAQAPTSNGKSDAHEKSRLTSESVFARTAGFIALQRQDYATADRELKVAVSGNPQDALTFLWLSATALGGNSPDLNSGLFYLARAERLSPQIPLLATVLKQSYVTVHGSEKGLDKLQEIARSDTAPPPDLDILPKPKKERHYGAAIAATAIVGLLVYAAVAHPESVASVGQSLTGGESSASGTGKLMVFAGSNHETYLGCLNCAESAPDSISNEFGPNGSKYAAASIWNRYGQFGSAHQPYSACNPHSADPPIIVDDSGAYYGRLTVNQFHPQLAAGRQLIGWLTQVVCAQ